MGKIGGAACRTRGNLKGCLTIRSSGPLRWARWARWAPLRSRGGNGSATIQGIKKSLMARIAGRMVRRRIPGSRYPTRPDRSSVGRANCHAALRQCCNIHVYTSGNPIEFRDAREPGRRVLGRAFLAVFEIDVDEAEALRVTLAPLEIVEQAPAVVGAHRHAVADRAR